MLTDISNVFEAELPRNAANHEVMSPVHYLRHTALIYPDHTAVIHGDSSYDMERKVPSLQAYLEQVGLPQDGLPQDGLPQDGLPQVSMYTPPAPQQG